MEWKKITIEEPKDGERVLVWNSRFNSRFNPGFNERAIRVFNKEHNCWDTEDGDYFDCYLDKYDFWMSLPEKPEL
jgi:hypothetical protein